MVASSTQLSSSRKHWFDAELFAKAQVLSSVGAGADVGLHPISTWNNPEPEVVLAVSSRGEIKGATLGNDVNLRDVEGRSALLLSKAKDNNASCAIGPMIRLFDAGFTLDDVRTAELALRVVGEDGYVLEGSASMALASSVSLSASPSVLRMRVTSTAMPVPSLPDRSSLARPRP